MIVARFFRRGGELTGFEITGHAGYAEEGYDIVCSAVSAISQTIAMGLSEVMKLPVQIERDDDAGRLRCLLPDGVAGGAQVLLKTLKAGLKSIEESYPGYLRVTG